MTDQLAQASDPRQRPAPPPPAVESTPAAPAPDQPAPADGVPSPPAAAPLPDGALTGLFASLPGTGPIQVTLPAWSAPPAGIPFDGPPPLDRDGLLHAPAALDVAPPPPPLLALQHAHPQDHELVPPTVDGVPIPGFGLTGVSGAVPIRLGGHLVTLGPGIGDGGADHAVATALVSAGLTIVGNNGHDPNLGAGSDTLVIGGGSVVVVTIISTPVTVSPVVQPVSGTAGPDQVTINGSLVSNAVVDLGNGTDTLTLVGSGPVTVTATNTEVIVGNDAGDSIRVTGATSASISGGSGTDTIRGGTGADTITGNGGGDSLIGGNQPLSGGGSNADRFDYRRITDSFTNATAAGDSHTDVIGDFDDSLTVIDFTALAGSGTQSFTGLKTGASFAAAFAGGAAGDVDYAVIGGTTFVHVHQGAGYSAGDLLIALQGTHALTATNLHLHP